MQVEFVGKKAQIASNKHFRGKKTEAEMKSLVIKVIRNAEYVGKSDRANAGHDVARIIWGTVDGVLYGIVVDGKDIKKNKATVVSFYDVHNAEHKAKRFGMKKVK